MYREHDKIINKHWIYLDDNNTPILLPCLFARYTQILGKKVELKSIKNRITDFKEDFFEEIEIGNDAANKICSNLGQFLEWIDNDGSIDSHISIFTHTALPTDVINGYINEYLIEQNEKSEVVANKAVNSLRSYYNWLQYFFDNKYKNIGVYSSHRALARENNKQTLVVKYFLPQTRELLYRQTDTLLEEIVLRNGGELGCRTKENQGFLLNDFNSNTIVHKGLYSLFEDLDKHSNRDEFEYHLPSLFTKYGTPRKLYIPRDLLEKMKVYVKTERPQTDSNHLLVSNSRNNTKGKCISTEFASNTFKKVKNKLIDEMKNFPHFYDNFQTISIGSVYHHLRHSFGTDIFYNLCNGANKRYESITTTSAVFIETARRLGHKVDSRYSNSVTVLYIHSCGHREQLLKATVNG